MSGDSAAAADNEITKFGDSTEFSPPLKKPKTDPVGKAEAEAEEKVEPAGEDDPLGRPPFLPIDCDDPKYKEQADLFMEQVDKYEGFYMDLDKFDYKFAPVKFEWGNKFDVRLSNKDLMDLLIKTAIEAKNEDYGTQLEFVEYVSCNVTAAQGFCFYITLWAKDPSSPNPEPKLYQTLVRKFRGDLHVHEFKLKPSQQE
ncbi:hypothetical protein Rs2_15288 [Raphanus sativus]|uniref:Uncharacterized protein LOC108811284 n=1 Tax=Raphanus sativus TaxID=3726 RepID=A0A6J0JT17_RAPSA|nr:uncharacterized protein LOC108811284 [Raphanus sativus]KAJ4901337.1 hypothetical protein Rs2_15288 [Raphanus sativus]